MKIGRILVYFFLLLFCAFLIVNIIRHHESFQWDFDIYYFAAKADNVGLDPYDLKNLNSISGKNFWLPYVYPPVTLWFFKLFALLPYNVAWHVWLIFKLVLIALVLYLWKKYFLSAEWSSSFYIFLLLAYDATLYWDIRAGNISIFEQLLLWSAFACFLKERLSWFSFLIIIVSIFKAPLIFFLILLPYSTHKNKWKYFVGSLVAVPILLAIGYFSQPDKFAAFLQRAGNISEKATDFNYSMYVLLKDFCAGLPSIGINFVPSFAPILAYLLLAGVIFVWSLKTIGFGTLKEPFTDRRLIIFFFCFVYALIVPRLKCYSFILLLPASYYIMKRYLSLKAYPILFLALVLPSQYPLPYDQFFRNLFLYYPLYLTLLVYICFLYYIRDFRPSAPASIIEGPENHVVAE